MHILEEGILDPSEIHFLMPSIYAAKNLYYLQHIGIFYCDSRYVVTHPYWESILVIFIEEGELEVFYRDHLLLGKQGDVIIMDCRYEHSYHAWDGLKFHYFHCSGSSSQEYAQLLYELNSGPLIHNIEQSILNHTFQNLLQLAKSQTSAQNEHRISVYLHMILCELTDACYSIPAVVSNSISEAIEYMNAHITESISLDDIAKHVNLSKYYFNRHFKRHMGMTLHQYFLNMRVQYAKSLLLTNHDSIEQIAEQCGFDNSSNFIRLFKQLVGMTPTAFRKIPF